MTITKDEIDKLRNERPTPGADLTYTPGGSTEERVHMTTEARRIGQINQDDRKLCEAVTTFRDNMLFKTQEGRARAQFNYQERER